MLLPISQRPRNTEENVLPLINVVFLLLIFFMLAGAMTAADPFEVEPPKTKNAVADEIQPKLVVISAEGRYALQGKEVGRDELLAMAADWARQEEPPPVRIKADGRLPADDLIELLGGLGAAGLEQVKLLTLNTGR